MQVIITDPLSAGLMVRSGKVVEVSAKRGQRWLDAGWAKLTVEPAEPKPDKPAKKPATKKKP